MASAWKKGVSEPSAATSMPSISVVSVSRL